MIKKIFLTGLLFGMLLVVSGCSQSAAVAAIAPSATAFLTLNPTSSPTAAPTQAITPTDLPSATPTTADLLPSPTPELSPTPTEVLPTPTVETSSTVVQPASQTVPSCIDKAAFSDDVTYPDGTLVHMGDTITKTWKIHNEGTCTWTGYNLIYAGGEAMNSPMSTPIQEVKPGEYADISVQLQVPQRGGSVTGYFEFQNASGQNFGVGAGADGLIWVQVTVDYVAPAAQTADSQASTSQDSPSQASTSQTSTSQSSTSQVSSSQASASLSTQSGCAYTPNSDYESQILTLVNDARAQNGLKPLTLDAKLSAAAMAHSIDMACNDLVSHTGSDGSTWYDRVKAQGFANYTSTRENIYVGNPAFGGDAQGAFTWWMNSKIHHDNIMYPTVTAIGIGYAYTTTSSYGGYYTLELARP